MTYTLPQVLVYEEFTQSPLAVGNPLRAIVVGPNAKLFRYSDADEKALIGLGAYDPTQDTDYEYPNRPTGGIVDQSYFKLLGEDVLLMYFHDAVGISGTQAAVAGYTNRIRSSNRNYKENIVGNTTYARDAAFLDRDVQVGDVCDVTGLVDSVSTTIRSTIRDIIGDLVPAVVSAATAAASNQATIVADNGSIAQTVGPYNCIEASAAYGAYNGAADGDVVETYTVKVTSSSAGGDLTTARLKVTSASGNDDADDVVPAALGAPTAIGSRGLTVTFDFAPGSCSLSASMQAVSETDLLDGQTWVIEVEQQFTAATATSGGTYTGDIDTTYIVEVTRGGNVNDSNKPQITCTTVHGVDVSGPTEITATNSAVPVGALGLTIKFSPGVLCKHDIYYINATAAFEGNMRTLVLSKNLPQDMLDASDLDLKLYIKKDSLQFPAHKEGSPPDVNYDLGDAGDADTGFTVKADMEVFDSSWTDGGVEQPLPVMEATLFAEYRAWVGDVADSIYGGTIDNIDDLPGANHPDNPLKFAFYKAASNSNGVDVLYIAVTDPDDPDAWAFAIEKMVGYRGLHGIVPLTTSKTIVDLFVAHALSQSSETAGRWRRVWTVLVADETAAIVDASSSEDGTTVLATTTDDPDVSGNQYRIFNVPAGNGNFLTNGVRAGDVVRYNYTTDGWGDVTYDSFVVDAVINEDSLRTKTGTATANSVAKKLEVWRTYKSSELATQVAAKAAAFGNARVSGVWPDIVGNDGETFSGMFLAAAKAGLRSGVLPQQGMTNLEISGFDDMSRSNKLFNGTQLNVMANAGVSINIMTDTGKVVCRHELTTAGYGDVLEQEEMIRANVDSMSMVNLESLEDLIGICNVVPGTVDVVELRLEANIDRFKQVSVARIGGQLVDGKVLAVRPHRTLADRLVAELQYTVPAPLNNLEVHEQIVV